MATAAWRAATDIRAPDFDGTALERWLDIVGDPTPTIRQGLPMIPPPSWRDSAAGLTTLFALDRPQHCFHAAPHLWARFHEPQITGGFAHFLSSGTHRQQVARVVAFAAAAAVCAGRDAEAILAFDATSARCVAEENRTDILIELRRGAMRIGAVVEAKFGHRLTKGQLPKARKHAGDVCGFDLNRSMLLVVTPDVATLDRNILNANRKYGWRAASWWVLLEQIERFTAQAHDCDGYRRFRRTVWHRAY